MPKVLIEVDNWEGREARAGRDQPKLPGSLPGCLMPGFLYRCSAESGSQGLVDAETATIYYRSTTLGFGLVGGT